jgi:hypothetical protein
VSRKAGKVVVAAAFQAGKRRGKAKNSVLRQAAPKGRAPVSSPRSAQSGNAVVPVSTIALPPGEGPPMSSTPSSAGRGGAHPAKPRARLRPMLQPKSRKKR